MKRFLFSVLAFAACASLIQAQDPELDRLKKSYEAAVERATAPLRTTYAIELKRLAERHTRAGKMDEARAVMAQLDILSGKPDPAQGDLEKLVTGKTFRFTMGSTYKMDKGGDGIRFYNGERTKFVWKVLAPDLIEITGKLGPSGSVKSFYLKINSLTDMYYGESTQDLTAPLALDS